MIIIIKIKSKKHARKCAAMETETLSEKLSQYINNSFICYLWLTSSSSLKFTNKGSSCVKYISYI